jgi:hypothetical protein
VVDVDKLRSGDLIGVSAANSDFSRAIGTSGETEDYDHLGLVERDGQRIFVWNANPTIGVAKELLTDFITRESENEARQFHAYRPKQVIDIKAALAFADQQLGLPYNHSFQPSETSFYCADLIARAFPPGFFAAKPMQFKGDYWTDYYRKLGTTVPHDELGYHPSDMLAQNNLSYLGELTLPICGTSCYLASGQARLPSRPIGTGYDFKVPEPVPAGPTTTEIIADLRGYDSRLY